MATSIQVCGVDCIPAADHSRAIRIREPLCEGGEHLWELRNFVQDMCLIAVLSGGSLLMPYLFHSIVELVVYAKLI